MVKYEVAAGVEPHSDCIDIKVVAIRPVPNDDVLDAVKEDLELIPDVLSGCTEIVFDEERSKRPAKELQYYVGKSLAKNGLQVTYVKRVVRIEDEDSIFGHLEDTDNDFNASRAA